MTIAQPTPAAAYVHVPFCAHRCGYCNFTLLAGRDDLMGDYLTALERELSWLGEPRPVETLFLGGGTPTRLPPAELTRLLRLVRHWFPLAAGGELSVEANPADMTSPCADALAAGGVTRISLGAQSFNSAKLKLLERDHDADQIAAAVEQARRFADSISLDLIFAAPGETLVEWEQDLAAALALRPDHLSCYGLTFERGTAFWSRLARGELQPADEELERAMYLAARQRLAAERFEHYEVSNFARPGHRCRHNLMYWHGREYFAAGPGAARHLEGRREVNHRSTTTWMRRVLAGESPVAESETLAPQEKARERLVFGLRMLDGVDCAEFARQTGYSIDQLVGPALDRFTQWGLFQQSGGRLMLTSAGLLVSDAIWPEFLSE